MADHRKPLILALLLALLPVSGHAAPPPASLPFTLKEVGSGVYAAIDNPDHSNGANYSYANGGFVVGDDGVLVIDSFVDPAPAEALLAEIRKITTKPVRYLVNTHFHLDHVTGNVVFHDAGALIVTHRNARGWIKDENMARSRLTEVALALYAKFPAPDIVTDQPMTIYLGSRRVDIRPAAGHTGGDLTVSVPDAKVVFAGDLLWRKRLPTTTDGNTQALLAELVAFERMPEAATTTFVPGHGETMTLGDVAEFRAHIADVATMTADARRAGLHGEALTTAVTARLKPRYGDWQGFERGQPYEIRAMDEELAGTKRVPTPR